MLIHISFPLFFFFFQAEDGIRDIGVTGAQTCALPIYQPFLALGMTTALFSLAGMPLFAGFFTKFILFQVGWSEGLQWLSALAVVNSLISLYYYQIGRASCRERV